MRSIFICVCLLDLALLRLFPGVHAVSECKQVTAKHGDFNLQKFDQKIRHRIPVIMKNLTKSWHASQVWTSQSDFMNRHGNLKVIVREQVALDEVADGGAGVATIQEYLTDTSLHHLIQFSFDNLDAFRALHQDYKPLPKVLRRIHEKPAFILGARNGTGSAGHSHEEVWVAQIAGRKVWLVAPPGQDDHPSTSALPCTLLQAKSKWPQGAFSCAVQPGEVIYVPDDWYHATCNMDDFTLAVGGKGDTSNWPDYMYDIQARDEQSFESHTLGAKKDFSAPVEGIQAIHLAAMAGSPRMLSFLIQHRADPQALDSDGRRPIHCAVEKENIEIIDYLLSKRFASIHDATERGDTPIHDASFLGHIKVTEWLLSKSADVRKANFARERPVQLAASWGKSEVVKLLLANRADPADRGPEYTTPLHWAARSRSLHTVELLLQTRAAVDASDVHKKTPLHWAAEAGLLSVVKALVSHRAAVNARTSKGLSAAEIAREADHADVVRYLSGLSGGNRRKRRRKKQEDL